MKRIFNTIAIIAVIAGALCACNDFDGLRESADSLDARVTALENQVKMANDNIETLRSAVRVMEGKTVIISADELLGGDGVFIRFSDGSTATIKNGQKGKDGDNVADGQNGYTPEIGIRKDIDNLYYWTLNGDWLLVDGLKVRANGIDGNNGYNGEDAHDGVDGITPQLRILEGTWQVSVDEGANWTDVETGGEYVIFKSVDISDPAFVTLFLLDGTELRLTRGAGKVESIDLVPKYQDGSAELIKGNNTFFFKVLPAESAEALALLSTDCFTFTATYTIRTKASVGEDIELPVIALSRSEDEILVTVDASGIDDKVFEGYLAINGILSIDDGVSCVNSNYFRMRFVPPLCKGTAPVIASAGRPDNSCGWVQLWEGGPKFAEFNVGATIANYGKLKIGTDPAPDNVPYYNTANVGGLYPWHNPEMDAHMTSWDASIETGIYDVAKSLWGENWREPTKEEAGSLFSEELIWTWCDGSSFQYCPGCTLKGYKVSGKPGSFYNDCSIFLPATGIFYIDSCVLTFIENWVAIWTNLGDDWDGAYVYITDDGLSMSSQYALQQYGFSIRAVLDE